MELVDICLNYYVLWISFLSGIWSNLRPKKQGGGQILSPPAIPTKNDYKYKWIGNINV